MRRWMFVVFCLFSLGVGSSARAQGDAGPEAARLFQEGRKRYAAGKYVEAAVLFERANGLAPHASVAFNAAIAWDQAEDLPRAADRYAEALRGTLDEKSRTRTEKRLSEIEPTIGLLAVRAPKGTRLVVGGRSWSDFPTRIHLSAGTALLEFTLPDGDTESKSIELAAGETRELDLTPAGPVLPEREKPRPKVEPTRVNPWKIAGVAAIGVSAGLAVTSALLWRNAKQEREALIDGDAGARDRAQKLETWTNVTVVSSVALGAAGITVLLILPGESKGTGSLRLRVGREISVSGRF